MIAAFLDGQAAGDGGDLELLGIACGALTWRASLRVIGMNSHEWTARDLVFTTRTGRPVEPRNLARSSQRITTSSGLRPIRPHDLAPYHRHSAQGPGRAGRLGAGGLGADPGRVAVRGRVRVRGVWQVTRRRGARALAHRQGVRGVVWAAAHLRRGAVGGRPVV